MRKWERKPKLIAWEDQSTEWAMALGECNEIEDMQLKVDSWSHKMNYLANTEHTGKHIDAIKIKFWSLKFS